MIELNIGAKPYSPLESIIGVQLMMEVKGLLVGSHGYLQHPPEGTPKDACILISPKKWDKTVVALLNLGWAWAPAHKYFLTHQVAALERGKEKLFATLSEENYKRWYVATQICKALKPSKTAARNIYSVVCHGSVEVTFQDDIEKVWFEYVKELEVAPAAAMAADIQMDILPADGVNADPHPAHGFGVVGNDADVEGGWNQVVNNLFNGG